MLRIIFALTWLGVFSAGASILATLVIGILRRKFYWKAIILEIGLGVILFFAAVFMIAG